MIMRLANDVSSADISAVNWEGPDDPVVRERLRSTIALLEPIVQHEAQATSPMLDMGLVDLMCAHAVLGEAEAAKAYGQTLYNEHSGMWIPAIYLVVADLAVEAGDHEHALHMYERVANFDGYQSYAKYRIAWMLLHPTIIDQARAVQLLEEAIVDTKTTWPRLGRLLRHRAALELRALGREVEVPELLCTRGETSEPARSSQK